MPDCEYAGAELKLFAKAVCWKSYVASMVGKYLVGEVLEVGAGLGSMTRRLRDGRQTRWVALEPDANLAGKLSQTAQARPFRAPVEVVVGTVRDFEPVPTFDAIVYADVLEHVEDDRGELEYAAGLLRPGGRLIVLAPAHRWLYSPFDAAIGHFRRYSARSLARIAPRSLEIERMMYLDSVGMLASIGNRFLLARSIPSMGQLVFWDRRLVRLSRVLDAVTGFRVGKSVVGIWRRPTPGICLELNSEPPQQG